MFEHKLGPLESLGDIFLRCFLDDPRAREPDQGFRLGHDDVAQRGKACHNPSRGRMGQHRNKGQARLPVARHGGAGFGHLHETEKPLVHPGTARGTDDYDRQAGGQRPFKQSGYFFAHHGTHTAA